MTSTKRRVEKEKPGRRERIIVSYTCATIGSKEEKTFIKPQKLQSNKLFNSISNGDGQQYYVRHCTQSSDKSGAPYGGTNRSPPSGKQVASGTACSRRPP